MGWRHLSRKGSCRMEPKEHWHIISMSLVMGLTTFIGVLFGEFPWLPVVVAGGAYGLGWARYLLRGLKTPKR